MIRFSNAFLKAKITMNTLPLFKVILVCCDINKDEYEVNKEYELSQYKILKTLCMKNHKTIQEFKNNGEIIDSVFIQGARGIDLVKNREITGLPIFSVFSYNHDTKKFNYILNDLFVQNCLFVEKNYTDLNMSIIGDIKSIYQCKIYCMMATNINFKNKYTFKVKELFETIGYKGGYSKFIDDVITPLSSILNKHGFELLVSDIVRKGTAAKSPVVSISMKMNKIKQNNIVAKTDRVNIDDDIEIVKLKNNIDVLLTDMNLHDKIEEFGILETKILFKSSCNQDREFALACIYEYCIQNSKSAKNIKKYPFAIARNVLEDESCKAYDNLLNKYKNYMNNCSEDIVIESLDSDFKILTFEENINNIASFSNAPNATTVAKQLHVFLESGVEEDVIIAAFYEVINKDKDILSFLTISTVINEILEDKSSKKKQSLLDRYERHLKYNGNNYDKDDRVDKVLTELVKYKKAPTIKDIKSARELVVNYSTNQIISKMNEIFNDTYNSTKGYNLGYIQKIIESGANGKPIKSKSLSNYKKESNENRRVIGFKECNISGKDIRKKLESQLGTGQIVDFDFIFRKK